MNSSLSQFTGTMRVALAGAILLWCAPPEFAFATGGVGQQQTPTQNEKDKEAAAKAAREKKSPPQAKPGTQSGTNTKPGGQVTPNGTGAAPAQPNTPQPGTQQTKPTPGVYIPPGTQTGGQLPVNPRATPPSPNAVTPNPRQSPVYPSPTYQPQQPVYQPGVSYPATQGARTVPIEDTGVCPADPVGTGSSGFISEAWSGHAPGATSAYGQGSNAARFGNSTETPRTISPPTVAEKFPQNDLKFTERPPIRFEPFPMVDLETGKPVGPNAIIRLPDGKQTTAQAYYKELNTYEQWINQQGQTLRQPQKDAIVTVASLDVNEALLRRQVEQAPRANKFSLRSLLDKIAGITHPVTFQIRPEDLALIQRKTQLSPAELATQAQRVNRSCLRSGTVNGGLMNPAAFGAAYQLWHLKAQLQAQQNPCQPINDQKPIGPWEVGDPAHFNAYLKGNISFTGQICEPPDLSHFNVNNHTQLSLTADAEAGGYVFNSGGDILRVTGSASGNGIANTVSASFNVFVLGTSVYGVGYGPSASYTYTHTFPIVDVQKSANTIVMAGPIPIDLTIGFKGTADVDLSLYLYPTSVAAVVTPEVDTSVYGQAGVTVYVAEAGVGAELVLEKASFTALDTSGITYRVTEGGYRLHSELSTFGNLNTLSGDFYVYLKYYYFCFSHGICSTQDNYNLWSWPGMNYSGLQYDDEVDVALNW
jgi:hypothetical protein